MPNFDVKAENKKFVDLAAEGIRNLRDHAPVTGHAYQPFETEYKIIAELQKLTPQQIADLRREHEAHRPFGHMRNGIPEYSIQEMPDGTKSIWLRSTDPGVGERYDSIRISLNKQGAVEEYVRWECGGGIIGKMHCPVEDPSVKFKVGQDPLADYRRLESERNSGR
jgi:hypothetical protein